jgi:hypothetical protein
VITIAKAINTRDAVNNSGSAVIISAASDGSDPSAFNHEDVKILLCLPVWDPRCRMAPTGELGPSLAVMAGGGKSGCHPSYGGG